MRWSGLTIGSEPPTLPGAVVRTFDTPGFSGMTFYEVRAKSIINKAGGMFGHTINPYRGCTHSCGYCFARNTHTYLDLDAGHDFDTKIVVKVNAVELLQRELSAAKWRGESIAMGTNVDCYQRAEGRYELMPGIITALSNAHNPFSILTKGTLIQRDLPLLLAAAERTRVSVAFSVGFLDQDLWRTVESGAPSPSRRLDTIRAFTSAGMQVATLMAPILPGLSDSTEQIDATVAALAEAGASSVTPIPLHLRTGAREWYLLWLREHHPDLLPLYKRIYGDRAYASKDYQRLVTARTRRALRRHGLLSTQDEPMLRETPEDPLPTNEQLTLL